MMHILVQEIVVRWTKKSRGAVGASKRNAIPENFIFPDVPNLNNSENFIHQHIHFSESQQFELPHGETKVEKLMPRHKVTIACTTLEIKSGKLGIKYVYTPNCTGAPRRYSYPRKKILDNGEWLQIIYNGRFGWSRGWSYHKTVINIALLDQFNRDIFLTEQTYQVNDMANLF